jgi:aryl-alcohol dehydrogenase-like predicted oxidoreductase
VTQQIHYTLEAREAEYELLPLSVDQGLGVLVWSPLAAGLLTGKHRRGAPPPQGSRQAKGWSEPPIRDTGRLWTIVDVLVEVAAARGATPAQVALAWLLARPAVTSLVVGGRTEAQFVENFGAVDVKLTDEDMKRLNDVSRLPLIYPYWHQHNFARPRFSEADQALHADYPDRHYGGEDPLV